MATIQKRGNSFSIRVSCGYDTQGKQVIQSKTWTPDAGMTERQIQKELERQKVLFEEDCKKGFQSKAVKFETFCEDWLAEYAKPNLRNTTYERLCQLRRRVYKAIGHLRMDKITPRQIQMFVNSLTKDGTNEINGKGLAPKTIKHYLSFISDVFTYGVKMGSVAENPCSKVTIPKVEQKEKQIYSPSEVTRFFEMLEEEPLKYQAFFKLAVFSGYRRGELLGLEWKDIDWDNNVISVRRTSCYTVGKGVYTDITKTRRSQRTLKFPQEIMDLLRKLQIEQSEERAKLGDHWTNTDRLFVRDNGEPQHPNTTYNWLKRFCERHNSPFYGIHQFRHFFASALVNSGVDIVTVSGALGHSSVTTTSTIYCHVLENSRAKVSEAITNVLNFSSGKGA